jgi:hypothetical protein
MSQKIASLTYNETNTTVASVSRDIEYLVAPDDTNPNKIIVTGSLDLSDDGVRQVSTITITSGTTGNEYAVAVQVVGQPTLIYRHKQPAGATAVALAAFLATLIDTNPHVVATATGAVITVKSAVAGVAFTLDNSDSTTVGNVVVATTTAAAGTAKHRKLFETALIFGVNATGFITVTSDGKFYDGAMTPVLLQNYGPIGVAIAPKAITAIAAAQV